VKDLRGDNEETGKPILSQGNEPVSICGIRRKNGKINAMFWNDPLKRKKKNQCKAKRNARNQGKVGRGGGQEWTEKTSGINGAKTRHFFFLEGINRMLARWRTGWVTWKDQRALGQKH